MIRRFADAVNCVMLAPFADIGSLRSQLASALDTVISAAFAAWSDAAGIDFRAAAPGTTADILVGAQARPRPRRVAFVNVWWDASRARDGNAPLTRAAICLNPALAWSVDDPPAPGSIGLRSVLAHEIGHAIGLDHPGATGALMGYRDTGLGGLMPGDVSGARMLYGESD